MLIKVGRLIDGRADAARSGMGILVTGRRITAVGPVAEVQAKARGAQVIDLSKMTVLPGFIDTHRHLLTTAGAEPEAELARFTEEDVVPMLEALLEMGFTTIFSTGDPVPNILDVRARLRRGELRGPRLFAVGKGFTAPGDWPTQLCGGVASCIGAGMVATASPEEAAAAGSPTADRHRASKPAGMESEIKLSRV